MRDTKMEINVDGFFENVPNSNPSIPYPYIRKFQKKFIDEIDLTDILFLCAPTGSGKTLCFEYLCRKTLPTLLIYPTTALMKTQKKQLEEHNIKVFLLDSSVLGNLKGYERSRKLISLFMMYDIIITNPDILSAIIHKLYINPEEDLLRIFSHFQYVIYDEFHSYQELELSDLLLQITLFLSNSQVKIVLSSATPSLEIISLIQSINPLWKINIIYEEGANSGIQIRFKTKVQLFQQKFDEKINDLIKLCISSDFKTLVMCNSNISARNIFNRLCASGYFEYVTKDTHDETKGDIKADLNKQIIISTAGKSELGLNYPLDAIIMDSAYSIQSFIQRFGRISQ